MLFALLFVACRSTPVNPVDSSGLLQPEFWTVFQGSLGCTNSGIHLTTWNPEGTVGMDIHIPMLPSDSSTTRTFRLDRKDAIVMVETGQEIPLNFCVDEIVEIPVQQVYHSHSGTVTLSMNHNNNQKFATVKLSGVKLKSESKNHQIELPDIQLTDVLIDARRKQMSNRPRLQMAPTP